MIWNREETQDGESKAVSIKTYTRYVAEELDNTEQKTARSIVSQCSKLLRVKQFPVYSTCGEDMHRASTRLVSYPAQFLHNGSRPNKMAGGSGAWYETSTR